MCSHHANAISACPAASGSTERRGQAQRDSLAAALLLAGAGAGGAVSGGAGGSGGAATRAGKPGQWLKRHSGDRGEAEEDAVEAAVWALARGAGTFAFADVLQVRRRARDVCVCVCVCVRARARASGRCWSAERRQRAFRAGACSVPSRTDGDGEGRGVSD